MVFQAQGCEIREQLLTCHSRKDWPSPGRVEEDWGGREGILMNRTVTAPHP